MYSTVIRQQHMLDRTEQERLLLYFIALKYCKTKGSIQRSAMHILCAEWCSWNTESQHTGCTALWVRIEKKSTGGRYIDKYCIQSVREFTEPFLLTVLNLSDCALEESLTVVTERDARFECWMEDDWLTDRQTDRQDAAERRVYVNLNLTT